MSFIKKLHVQMDRHVQMYMDMDILYHRMAMNISSFLICENFKSINNRIFRTKIRAMTMPVNLR